MDFKWEEAIQLSDAIVYIKDFFRLYNDNLYDVELYNLAYWKEAEMLNLYVTFIRKRDKDDLNIVLTHTLDDSDWYIQAEPENIKLTGVSLCHFVNDICKW